ncbi:hypothetical protein Hesp01_28030 [Herbidospora sp. NBRC 101105]|nr:hypothetical protein Hesp01_28030 [Herbidospora sp. NBRC 101105]
MWGMRVASSVGEERSASGRGLLPSGSAFLGLVDIGILHGQQSVIRALAQPGTHGWMANREGLPTGTEREGSRFPDLPSQLSAPWTFFDVALQTEMDRDDVAT